MMTSFSHTSLVRVYYIKGQEQILMGRLILKDRKIYFEYDATFIGLNMNLSPFKLPLGPSVIPAHDHSFEGLFGVFNDSLPDGWARLLLDRKLMKLGINPRSLSPLDRLCYVGTSGMGALIYKPENTHDPILTSHDLDEISNKIIAFRDNDHDAFIDELLGLGGALSGARPKILMEYNNADWIIKFRSSTDPKDISCIEYAYHLMAIDAKLDIPEAKLFPSRLGLGYFGVKRFDRHEGNRIHMHTISGLLHADHREPSLDYQDIMKATQWLTKDLAQVKKQFQAAVFNIITHNRDDHSKNFSFLMNADGQWSVSPAYDLTFSSGPSGEHCTLVMGEGKHPGLEQILALGHVAGINKPQVLEIIDEVLAAASQWSSYSEKAQVSKSSRALIQEAIKKNIKRCLS